MGLTSQTRFIKNSFSVFKNYFRIGMLAGIVSILMVLFTLSFQAIKAALSNPVHSLRSE